MGVALLAVVDPGFPNRRGDANSKGLDANLLFWLFFSENCIQLKILDQKEDPLLDPPMTRNDRITRCWQ